MSENTEEQELENERNELDQETSEYIELSKKLGILMATRPDIIRKLYLRVDKFVGELAIIGNLKSEEEWNNLEVFNMRVPKKLASMLRLYHQANNRLNRLEIQYKKLKFDLMLTAQESHGQNRQLQPKDKELAILNDERYEQALIQYNVQKNLVDYLDKTVDQYKFLNNSVNTRVEIAKLRKELGF